MKRRTIAIAAAGVLVAAGAVVAVSAPGERGGWHRHGGHGGHGGMMFGDDGDGPRMHGRFGRSMTREEFDTRTRERFARIDKNSDGVAEPAEIEAAFSERMGWFGRGKSGSDMPMGQGLLRMFDGNRDGKVTRDEVRAEVMRRFAEMDLTRDGRIDDADLPPMLRGRNVLSGGDGPGMGMGPMGRRGGHGMGGMARLRQMDANRDGIVTREEAEAFADREHARFDRNTDGTVDQADLDALRKEMVDYRVKRFAHMSGAGPDGRITRDQFQAKAAERFQRMDWNNDGTISRDEMPGRGHGKGRHHRGDDDVGPMGKGPHGHGPGRGPGPGPGPAEGPPAKN